MMTDDVKISGEPMNVPTMCRFTVDRPLYPDQSFHFGSSEAAEMSPLAKRLFAIEGVAAVLITDNRLTVTKHGPAPWPQVGQQVGAAIREHLATDEPAVDPSLRETIPPVDVLRDRVQGILDREVNPSVASHGGVVRLLDVQENMVYVQMGGGCQGCGMADVTLKQGVEIAIRSEIPQVGEIMDTTDHASGNNPYYAPSKK
jgi:Fe-S cluster biogenesis protein NfuA